MRTILLGDIGNRLDIEDAEASIARLQASQQRHVMKAGGMEERVASLTAELGRQKLAVQALTRFLVAKGIVAEGELEDFIREVDAEDGVVDGRMTVASDKPRLKLSGKIPDGLTPASPPTKPS